ncbi:APC family permease [Phenylobacterium sp.]|uniref:APC family permease n=1 Tax=Phenylobacterium sp. TaxID=1871053 RepID=UPI0025D91063|nr:amino acid permease [Phenylobacterium sp.]MBX3484874.1 amino acid permease [Phenylobacterium sp.]
MTEQLRRGVRLIDLVMLGAGTAIGASIFSVLGPAAQIGHEAILVAVVLAALPMILFGMVYAYMASAMPKTAASFEWQRMFTHPLIAFAIVWLRILSNAVVMIVLGQVLVMYLGKVIAIPGKPVMFGMFCAVFALNFLGVAIAARAQTILMLMLLAVFAVFVAAGAPSWNPQLIPQSLSLGWTPALAALPLMIQLFLGIETTTEVGEEVADPKRVVPLGLALAVLLTVVVYVSIAFTAMSLVGADGLAASDAPLLTAAEAALGGWATPLIVTAAVLALSKSMNAVFLVFARFLYAMGKAGVLPAPLAAIHPRFGTPHVATVAAFGACCLGLFLPSSLLFLLLAVNIPTMMKYLGSCLAAYNVATKHPEVHAEARLRFSRPTVRVLSVLGMIAAVAIASLGFGADWRPYALLAGWLVLGLVYYATRQRARARTVEAARRSE